MLVHCIWHAFGGRWGRWTLEISSQDSAAHPPPPRGWPSFSCASSRALRNASVSVNPGCSSSSSLSLHSRVSSWVSCSSLNRSSRLLWYTEASCAATPARSLCRSSLPHGGTEGAIGDLFCKPSARCASSLTHGCRSSTEGAGASKKNGRSSCRKPTVDAFLGGFGLRRAATKWTPVAGVELALPSKMSAVVGSGSMAALAQASACSLSSSARSMAASSSLHIR